MKCIHMCMCIFKYIFIYAIYAYCVVLCHLKMGMLIERSNMEAETPSTGKHSPRLVAKYS